MIVVDNKSSLESVKRFHNYLYDMSDENYELLEIYEEINLDTDELESKLDYNEDEMSYLDDELKEVRANIRKLLGRVKRWKRLDENKQKVLIEELDKISF